MIGAAVTGVRAASFPVRPGEGTGARSRREAAATSSCGSTRPSLARPNATVRLTEVSGVVHDIPLHGLAIDDYTHDGDADRAVRASSTRSSPL